MSYSNDVQKLFRLWLGVTEYLFRNPQLLEETITNAVENVDFASDDLEFTFAARVISLTVIFRLINELTWDQAWSQCVTFGDFALYRDNFEQTQDYFRPRFPEATKVGNEMLKTIFEKM